MRRMMIFLMMAIMIGSAAAAECCRICRKGKPCGDSCIPKSAMCDKPKGCACSPKPAKSKSPKAAPAGLLALPLYDGRVIQMIDGDTLKVALRGWRAPTPEERVRLSGIDAPEIRHAACAAEKALGEKARAFAVTKLPPGAIVKVMLTQLDRDSFGRLLARVSDKAGNDLGAMLVRAGLARPYDGKHKPGWCAP